MHVEALVSAQTLRVMVEMRAKVSIFDLVFLSFIYESSYGKANIV